MSEWQVVAVIIALVGLIGAIAGPVSKLNSAITRLSTIIEHALERLDKLEKDDAEIQRKGSEARKRIYERLDQEDDRLAVCNKQLENHELRISHLERKEEK